MIFQKIIFFVITVGSGGKSGPNRIKFGNDFVWRRYRKLTDVNNRLESEIDNLEHRMAQLEDKQLQMERDGMLHDEAIYKIGVNLTRIEDVLKVTSIGQVPTVTRENVNMTNRKPRGRKQRILIAGGVTENKNVFYRRDDSVLITVNQNKIILEEERLIDQVRSHCCGVVYENEFHLLGGQTNSNEQTNLHQKFVRGGWSNSVRMSIQREGLICGVFRGRIWACTGRTASTAGTSGASVSSSPVTNSCESWRPKETKWREESALTYPRFHATSAVNPTGLFIIGGNVKNMTNPQSTVYMPIVSGKDDGWQIGPEPDILRGTLGSSAIVIDSDIYLIGGYEPRTESLRNEIMYLSYNQVPMRSKWRLAGKLSVARYGMATLPLPNNNFIIVGGQSNKTTEFPFATIFKAVGGEVTRTNSMVRLRVSSNGMCPTRFFFAAAVLP